MWPLVYIALLAFPNTCFNCVLGGCGSMFPIVGHRNVYTHCTQQISVILLHSDCMCPIQKSNANNIPKIEYRRGKRIPFRMVAKFSRSQQQSLTTPKSSSRTVSDATTVNEQSTNSPTGYGLCRHSRHWHTGRQWTIWIITRLSSQHSVQHAHNFTKHALVSE